MSDFWGNLEPPIPIGYVDPDGKPDWKGFRYALRDEMSQHHRGEEFSTTTRGMAMHYFGRDDARAVDRMGQELSTLRAILEADGEELVNLNNRWWLAARPEDHLRYGHKQAVRLKGGVQRLRERLGIGARAFPKELGDHGALKSLPGAEAALGELETSLIPPKALESGDGTDTGESDGGQD